MQSDARIIVALDYPSPEAALLFADSVDPSSCRLKVGKQLFTIAGPALVRALTKRGFDVFLDLKFHDIPNTVAGACRAAADLGVWMLNVHASGGPRMLEAARTAVDGDGPLLIAVTVLTSSTDADLQAVGVANTAAAQVGLLADLSREQGLDGVVCSAQEAPLLRERCGKDFVLVTPGIRPVGVESGDQRRVVTPEQAVRDGVNYLVIGRPVTASAEPQQALYAINQSISALGGG
jgi:orotidine-5'-phosphate decarboxylase